MNTLYIVLASLLLLFVLAQLYRSKRAKNRALHIIYANCTGCRRCSKKCRHKALAMVTDETGLHVEMQYPEKCTACGDCIAACKFKALEMTPITHATTPTQPPPEARHPKVS
jgi:ferredoxin